MKNKGFYIKSIIATGEGVITSKVDFKDGCNLLFGPSEMGKSSVFSLIDFMLGKKDVPKLPPEGIGYDTFYMEIVTKDDGITHTVRRLLNDKTVIVKDCGYEQFENEAYKPKNYHVTNAKSNYSQYLMSLNGFAEGLQIRKSKTDKAAFTYTWIRHLILADENRIVSECPIFNPQNETVSVTQEKSVIYYLTTGKDDSDFEIQEKPEQRKYRYVGMIELTQENIDAINKRILEIGDVGYADFKDENVIKTLQAKMTEGEIFLKALYSKRKELEEKKRIILSKRLFVSEFIKRMRMLQKHYQTDLGRYEYIYEGASLFNILSDVHVCPICHSEIQDKTQIDANYLDLIQQEYNQANSKLDEIRILIDQKERQEQELMVQINNIVNQLDKVEHEVNTFSIQLSSMKSTLERYQDNIEKKAELKFLQDESQRLYKKLDSLKKEKKEKLSETDYNRQTSIDEEFCSLIKDKLVYWNVLGEDEPVVFDEDGFDFVLGGKKRITCGKGARGVTCSAILMSLLEYCQTKNIPFSDVLVLDSPITAHFSDGSKEYASESTQVRFFKYCNDRVKDYQLIIIDNKSPEPSERGDLSNINYIEFSAEGRNGFYIGKA